MSVPQAAEMEMLEVPGGGIGTFVDEDIYGNDEPDFPVSGIGQYTEISDEIAGHGRFGDNVVAHLERGELVIPKELLDDDPAWRDSIFTYLSSQGVENPERYVVGSNDNSINPATGIREFFFKKIFKSVKKLVKKVAPVILPAALGFTPLGPIFGPMLGSGIASLITGGSVGDAFKSAAISGAMGAGFAGLSGMSSGKGFLGGIQEAFAKPGLRLEQFGSGLRNTASNVTSGAISPSVRPDIGVFDSFNPNLFKPNTSAYRSLPDPSMNVLSDVGEYPAPKPSFADQAVTRIENTVNDVGNALEPIFPRGPEAQAAKNTVAVADAKKLFTEQFPGETFTPEMAEKAVAAVQPGFKQYVGPAALAGVGAYALGAFDEEEDPSFADLADQAGFTRLDPLPPIYDPQNFRAQQNPYSNVLTTSGYAPVPVKDGGPIYPRRYGGIMPNEGVPGKDSVRALLMPGEFVMTTDAVRGAGDGNLKDGIKNMYSVMRDLESRSA